MLDRPEDTLAVPNSTEYLGEPYFGSEPPRPDDGPTLKHKAIGAAILVALALLSAFVLAPWASSPDTYHSQIQTLDEKKANVMSLTAVATGTSAAISALPDDIGSPIADKLADLSGYLIVILTVIYLEKFLITILGFVGTGVLVPIGLLVFVAISFAHDGTKLKTVLWQLAFRSLVFGAVISLVVPTSVQITNVIDATYADSISYNASSAEETTTDEADSTDSQDEESASEEISVDSIWSGITGFFEDAAETVTNASTEALNALANKLNELIDTIAVMIVTSCLIPIIVLLVCFWLANAICGLDLGSPDRMFSAASGAVRGLNANANKVAMKHRGRDANQAK